MAAEQQLKTDVETATARGVANVASEKHANKMKISGLDEQFNMRLETAYKHLKYNEKVFNLKELAWGVKKEGLSTVCSPVQLF